MMDIELVKREIAYRARYIGLRFDRNDILHADISPGSTFVALMRHYTYEESESDDAPMKVYHNLLWYEYPQATRDYRDNINFTTIINVSAPVLIVRIPFLAFWIKDNEKMELSKSGIWERMTNDILNSFALELSDTLGLPK